MRCFRVEQERHRHAWKIDALLRFVSDCECCQKFAGTLGNEVRITTAFKTQSVHICIKTPPPILPRQTLVSDRHTVAYVRLQW